MSNNNLLAAAQVYVGMGLSVIQVSAKTKKPIAEWKVFQSRQPTEDELKEGFAQANGLAIVCGAVSNNLEILDFDLKAELFPDWKRLVEEEAPDLLSRLVMERSQNLGFHVSYRCADVTIPGNDVFAQRQVDVGADVKRLLLKDGVNLDEEVSVKKALTSLKVKHGGKEYQPRLVNGKFIIVITLIESRGEGGYFLAHPTPGYELSQGDFLNLPNITANERQILINAAIALNEYVDSGKVEGFGYRLPKETRRPGDDFNERGDISEILVKHGWEPVGTRGAYQHFRRSGKDRGQSASLIDEKWFHVFSSNAYPFKSETTYSPFAIFSLLEWGGDFTKAASELAKIGYGKKEPGQDDKEKQTQQDILLIIAAAAELFHTPDEDGYAMVPIKGHRETWGIRSKGFRRWLSHEFYKSQKKGPQAEAMSSALQVLEAQAQFDGPERPVWVRIAEHKGAIYLDLGNEAWEAVKITPANWEVVADPPVCFRRTRGMTSLPYPARGGSVNELRPFLNVGSDDDFILMVAFLIGSLRPCGPYPVMVLNGEQGSAKSTVARTMAALIDPTTSPLRSSPREVRDLMIAASNSWVLGFDNLSGVSNWLSDAMCRLSTGGGFSTRELYTDRDEVIFDATRPIILNGIDTLAHRQDLADRSLIFNLPQIADKDRRPESKFWTDFEAARLRILGALLDAVSVALQEIGSVKLPSLPRMADFAMWVSAAEPALPWSAGSFMEAYMGNRAEAVELSLEADYVAVAVREHMADRLTWTGKPSELYEALETHVPENTKRSRAWPKAPNKLSGRLKRAATFLRAIGIDVEIGGWSKNKGREVIIRRVVQNRETTVGTVGTVEDKEPCLFFSNDTTHGIDGPSHDTENEPWERKAHNHAASHDTHDTHDTLHIPVGEVEELDI